MRNIPLILTAVCLLSCRQKEPLVAKVGGVAITEAEFRQKIEQVSPQYQKYVLTPTGRRQFLDVLIREKLVLAAAQDSPVRKSSEFKSQLERLREDEEERLREGRDYLLTQLWFDHLRREGTLKVEDEEVVDYHRKHPVEIHMRHVLMADPDEAHRVAQKARGGHHFAALAKAHSLDAATAADGGRMAPAFYGEIIPDLEDILFRMRVGEIAGPIKSKFGYHVLRKEAEKRPPLEEVRERITRLIEKQKLDRYLQSIQEKYSVEVIDEQFK